MALRPSRKAPAYTAHSAVANSPPSGTDLLQRLVYEHREFRKLWEDMQRAHIRDQGLGHAVDEARLGDANQFDLSQQILQALAEHEAIELELLYPAAARVMNDDWADHAREEHAEVRGLLESIEGRDPADEGVFEVFTTALNRIVAHMDDEDKVLFPIMRLVMTPDELIVDKHSAGITHVPPEPVRTPEVYVDITDRQLAASPHGDGHELGTAELDADDDEYETVMADGNGDGHETVMADGNGDGDRELVAAQGSGSGNGRGRKPLRVLRRR
jgi:hemerythrin-like domain-containing protein